MLAYRVQGVFEKSADIKTEGRSLKLRANEDEKGICKTVSSTNKSHLIFFFVLRSLNSGAFGEDLLRNLHILHWISSIGTFGIY